MGGKGGRCVGLTNLKPSCAVVMKSGNLNLLEPSGPLQACNGTVFYYINKAHVGCKKAKVTPVLIGATGNISKTRNEANYRKQPYCALHTYCGKY